MIKRNRWGFPKRQDSDRDRVPDHRDCRPWDPTRQHIKPNIAMQQRINKLPIYFTTGTASDWELERGITTYHITEKKVPREIEKARQRFYSMVRKRPDVIGEIERKRPARVIFTTKGSQIVDMYGQTIKESKEGRATAVVRLSSPGRGYPYRREEIEESVGTTIHELEHVRQARAWADKPKLRKRMRRITGKKETYPYGGIEETRPEEILARKAEEKAKRKRYRYPSPKKYHEDIRESFEEFEEE